MTTPVLPVPVYTGGVAIRGQKTNFSLYTAQQLTYESTLAVNMNASISGINALIPEIEAAANAASLSNFVGLYSSLTGALNVPASAYHLNQIWTLTEYVADVTLEVPGTSSKWVIPTNLRTGVDTTTSAADVTLTYASKTVQYLSMTAAEKFVVLPDVAVLQNGDFFDFFNDGAFKYGVKDSTGVFIAAIDVKGFGRITRVGDSWRASDGADLILARVQTILNSVNSDYINACKLTSTTVLVAWAEATKGLATVLTWASGTPAITESNQLEISATTIAGVSGCRMTDTVGIIGYVDTDQDGKICAVTYTPGTNTLALTDTHEFKDTAAFSTAFPLAVVPIYPHATDGKIGVMYYNSATDAGAHTYVQVLDWNGSTIESNTAEQKSDFGAASSDYSADVLEGTISTATMILSANVSGTTRLKKISWTGGNTLAYTSAGVIGTYGVISSVRAVSADYFVVAYFQGTLTTVLPMELIVALYDSSLTLKKSLYLGTCVGYQYMDKNSFAKIDSSTFLLAVDPFKSGQTTIYKIKVVGSSVFRDCVLSLESKTDIGRTGTTYANKNLVGLDEAGALFIRNGGNSNYIYADRIEVG